MRFSSTACSVISCIVVEIFMQKNSAVTKFWHLALGVTLIMPHSVYTLWQIFFTLFIEYGPHICSPQFTHWFAVTVCNFLVCKSPVRWSADCRSAFYQCPCYQDLQIHLHHSYSHLFTCLESVNGLNLISTYVSCDLSIVSCGALLFFRWTLTLNNASVGN